MEALNAEVHTLRGEVKQLSDILAFTLKKVEILEEHVRKSSVPEQIVASHQTTPSTISASSVRQESQRSTGSWSRASIPSCGTDSSMETTPLASSEVIRLHASLQGKRSLIPVRKPSTPPSTQKNITTPTLPAVRFHSGGQKMAWKPSIVDTNELYRRKMTTKLFEQKQQTQAAMGAQETPSASPSAAIPTHKLEDTPWTLISELSPGSPAPPIESKQAPSPLVELELMQALDQAVLSSPRAKGKPAGASKDPLPSFPPQKLLPLSLGKAAFTHPAATRDTHIAGTNAKCPKNTAVAFGSTRSVKGGRVDTPHPSTTSAASSVSSAISPRSHTSKKSGLQTHRAVRSSEAAQPVSKRTLLLQGGQLHHHHPGSSGSGNSGGSAGPGTIRGGGRGHAPAVVGPDSAQQSPQRVPSKVAQDSALPSPACASAEVPPDSSLSAEPDADASTPVAADSARPSPRSQGSLGATARDVLALLQSPVVGTRRRRSGGKSTSASPAPKVDSGAPPTPSSQAALHVGKPAAEPKDSPTGTPAPLSPTSSYTASSTGRSPAPNVFPSHLPTPDFPYTPLTQEPMQQQLQRHRGVQEVEEEVEGERWTFSEVQWAETPPRAGSDVPRPASPAEQQAALHPELNPELPEDTVSDACVSGVTTTLLFGETVEGMDTAVGTEPPPPTPAGGVLSMPEIVFVHDDEFTGNTTRQRNTTLSVDIGASDDETDALRIATESVTVPAECEVVSASDVLATPALRPAREHKATPHPRSRRGSAQLQPAVQEEEGVDSPGTGKMLPQHLEGDEIEADSLQGGGAGVDGDDGGSSGVGEGGYYAQLLEIVRSAEQQLAGMNIGAAADGEGEEEGVGEGGQDNE